MGFSFPFGIWWDYNDNNIYLSLKFNAKNDNSCHKDDQLNNYSIIKSKGLDVNSNIIF